MKRISIGFFFTFLLLILFSACQEYKFMDWKLMNDQWYAKHKNDSGFVTTSTGLSYKVIHQGWYLNRKPNINSYITVRYIGRLIDGSIFDSATTTLSLSGTIAGWKEGIPKMNNGGSYKFYIPSKLGYDTTSTNASIPPHSVLIFDVDLLDSYN